MFVFDNILEYNVTSTYNDDEGTSLLKEGLYPSSRENEHVGESLRINHEGFFLATF